MARGLLRPGSRGRDNLEAVTSGLFRGAVTAKGEDGLVPQFYSNPKAMTPTGQGGFTGYSPVRGLKRVG